MLTHPRAFVRWARRPVSGLIRLTRYREYVIFVTVLTLGGAKLGGGVIDLRLLLVLVANLLVVGFAFMYNDVEDAPDDAMDAKKAVRNPISAGLISPRTGKLACLAVAIAVVAGYAMLGLMPFLLGTLSLALAFLYSWRFARLKAIPVADLISHSLSLAGLQFLCAYFVYDQGRPYSWLFFLTAVMISVYGELNNELRDAEVDKKAGIRHTADLIGPVWTKRLMKLCAITGAAFLVAYFVLGLIPWGLLICAALVPLVMGRKLINLIRGKADFIDDREAMHNPVMLSLLAAVLVWFAGDMIKLF
ncbi:MAG TPA: prenyltransferase [Thermoflexales bacterium]|nr:prenyltransferase [Anaerolineae bacterium]HQV29366.1 prenyltransferase [Thermoflexales bacterium]HQZ54716.1 prenyltransferase [Thermoflexales bacterium]HRA54718.1 prenyltransferase [Thermoflexales bacterium]